MTAECRVQLSRRQQVVAQDWVLTAAHCMYKDEAGNKPYSPVDLKVVLGEHKLGSQGEELLGRTVLRVQQIVQHPQYDKGPVNSND